MKPLIKGQPTGMVEIPGSWYIDDLPPMMSVLTILEKYLAMLFLILTQVHEKLGKFTWMG